MKTSMKWVGTVCLMCLVVAPVCGQPAHSAQAPAEKTYAFNVPAQPLVDSLRDIGTVAGINVIFDPSVVGRRRAPAVKGNYRIGQVLKRLLDGSGLAAQFTDPGTVVVRSGSAGLIPSQSHPPGADDQALSGDNGSKALDEVVVVARVKALSATRSETPLREIPQSVSVISRETLDQQNATDLTSALEHAPGFRMERHSSQQSYIYSRGYLVNSVHIDGGAPVQIAQGTINAPDASSMNLAEYESIEVLRGSDGLFGGMGNPGATVSLNRKEPTSTYQASFNASLGSWNQRRFVGDISGPLTSGLSGRAVVSRDRRDYFYDIADKRGYMVYGVLKYDFNPATNISLGGSFQRTRSTKNSFGLPRYEDGSDPELPRSLSLTTPWSKVDNRFTEAFIKFQHDFNDDWKLRANASMQKQDLPTDIGATYRGPIDSSTGLLATPIQASANVLKTDQKMMNATLTGAFDWFGLEQNVMIGADYARNSYNASSQGLRPPGPAIDPFHYDPAVYPLPEATPENTTRLTQWNSTTRQWGIYGAFRFQPVEGLKLTVGGRKSGYDHGTGKAVSSYSETKFTPYAGMTYNLSKHYTLYASWADIYHTNTGYIDKNHHQIGPSDGVNLEAGLKGAWFNNSLNASLALFKVERNGMAVIDPNAPWAFNCCYMTADSKSKGYEIEVSGALTPNWQITAGYTRDIHSYKSRTLIMRKPGSLFKLWTNYRLPGDKWSVGGGLRTTSPSSHSTCTDYSAGMCHEFITYGQGFYAIADLRVGYRLNTNWSVALNVNNVFDRNYYQTLGSLSHSNWYGTPRNVMFKLDGKF